MKALVLAMILSLASLNAGANLILQPDDADWTTDINHQLSEAEIQAITGITEDLTLYYKAEVGGSDSGSFADSYDTDFTSTITDPENAHIALLDEMPAIDCPECLFIVKDGNHDPAQYLFNIGTWNGSFDVFALNFWPDQGAISNVAIYGYDDGAGGGGEPVPEPLTITMMGLGLVGLGAYTRRRKFKL